ncbi:MULTISPECIES: acyl-CoA synthetase [unclassified Nocardioides]|uniref:acyl-CoA synthetase n=1 Tax=unclassified Nocardioides TaxID=2615069 RepID=UPI0007029278|nr:MULTISPECIES: acyl-CoA synthetase [unclassified Nocardioides]KRC54162.1 acyl-CoA synthetase [Nocardioides sp. Root79]KRC71498.1 acyl-CoA synthetase [Nocardioides sp. Root240]
MYPGAFAQTTPDKPAILMADTGEVRTYAQLEENSIRLARALHDHGLRPGDHVAFLSTNAPQVFEVYWAALRSGLYVTGVNNRLSADEAGYVVDDCGARVLVVSADVADTAVALGEHTPGVTLRLAFGGEVPGFGSYDDALAASDPTPMADQPRGADMLYSSGTTGRPKGIKPPLPPRQVGEPGDMFTAVFAPMYGFDTQTTYYSPAPTYHAAPLRFGGIVHATGGTVVMTKKFDAETTLRIIEEHRVTHAQFVPTMFVRMLKLPERTRLAYGHETLRAIIHAAAPCPVEVKRAMIAWWGPVLHEYYASTEANGITLIRPEEWLEKPGSVGRAGLGIIHICDEDGTELPTGEDGTVYFERDTAPFEYHNDPEKSREARHPRHDGWTTTGDVGHVDEDGYLFLTDRKAFMIISGGVNIYPQEVENALALHPKVQDVAVIGVPDDEMGESVKAVVELPPGIAPSDELAAEIIAFVRDRIAHYKTPRSVDFVDALPRTDTGKLLKKQLTAAYAAVPAS